MKKRTKSARNTGVSRGTKYLSNIKLLDLVLRCTWTVELRALGRRKVVAVSALVSGTYVEIIFGINNGKWKWNIDVDHGTRGTMCKPVQRLFLIDDVL